MFQDRLNYATFHETEFHFGCNDNKHPSRTKSTEINSKIAFYFFLKNAKNLMIFYVYRIAKVSEEIN